jgi:hypothetical protein
VAADVPAGAPALADLTKDLTQGLTELTAERAGDLLAALEATGLAKLARESVWLYPTAEMLHIFGFVLLVGAAVMFDLRLLGLSRTVPVTAMAAHLLPWSRTGLAVVVPTGLLMFASDATATAANPAFRIKMLLILAAGLNVWAFYRGPFRSVGAWDRGVSPPPTARLAAVLSLLLWAGVIAAGRLIAYVAPSS